ncbi:MAG: 50S ribosomal protein L22/unknown domain fusion protein [Methanosaeta sp. PtaU1.Bin112]|nr:MAG: 50S ribosomal protein L22/unknown domain fusion protein [Methanosaeta sp. PtaU1.Bin112]
MDVLLSIKPKYIESIINGQKRYEFRKTIFRRNYINNAYIYATSPVKKIVGAFRIGEIIEDQPSNLWVRFNGLSGLNKDEFFSYFQDQDIGFAIEITDVEVFEPPIDPTETNPDFVPPQSFCYVRSTLFLTGLRECKKYRNLDG